MFTSSSLLTNTVLTYLWAYVAGLLTLINPCVLLPITIAAALQSSSRGPLALFGVILLIPQSQNLLATLSTPLADGANTRINRIQNTGLAGQFGVGVLLGAVWSPCFGPTLGGAVSLAASGESLGHATLTMIIFGGVATVLIGLAYGSRGVVGTRRQRLMAISRKAKPIMGAMLLLVGAAI